MLQSLLSVVQVFVSVVLIFLVLLHSGKDAGMSGAFGVGTAGGSKAAFEVMFTRHQRGVLSFCRHMLGSVEEAEDAVQHTFLAAYRDLVGSTKAVRLRPWLYAIARNRCLTVLRARRERADEPA